MVSSTTNGVKITVASKYEGKNESGEVNAFIFSYTITIENQTLSEIQLISRKWYIFDSIGITSVVEGIGVVGKQPKLKPGQSFTYSSWCSLNTEIGSMKGSYTMKDWQTDADFKVQIPCFVLIVPCRAN